jgi:hypothetical protein
VNVSLAKRQLGKSIANWFLSRCLDRGDFSLAVSATLCDRMLHDFPVMPLSIPLDAFRHVWVNYDD